MERTRPFRPLSRERALIWNGVVRDGVAPLTQPFGLVSPRLRDFDLADLADYAEWLKKRLAPVGDPEEMAPKPPLAPLTDEEKVEIAKDARAGLTHQCEILPADEKTRARLRARWARRSEEAKEKRRARDREYRQANREKIRARKRSARAAAKARRKNGAV